MINFKYYLLDNGAGKPYELYRRPVSAHPILYSKDIERAKLIGGWSAVDEDVFLVIDLWLKGEFDFESAEISEERALTYLDEWRASGWWPGRE